MTLSEPANLREWSPVGATGQRGRLFTCGRPGRATFGRRRCAVDETTIDLWVNGLPAANPLHIVSLLGSKKDGFSEFEYYPFRSSVENGTKPTFQQWLEQRYSRNFPVSEYPTVDAQGIPSEILAKAKSLVLELFAQDATIVVIDSVGAERTARVCEAAGFVKKKHEGAALNG